MSEGRPVPLLGDISLEYVQRIEHHVEAGFAPTAVAGLPGELQQRSARGSHRIEISGVLFGEAAADDLERLQTAASEGEELSFAADITSALDLERVVIHSFHAAEVAGEERRLWYRLSLAESPPLPPPAEIDPFGGLGDFGLGDLGFDTDILGELTDLAGDIAGAIDSALDVMDALSALANLGELGSLGGFLDPLQAPASGVSQLSSDFGTAGADLSAEFES